MKSDKLLNTISVFLYTGVSILLFIYVSYRAHNLSFTHDESLSYTIIRGDNSKIYTANNHLLNTVFMASSSYLFGESEFALRLPNILSFALFLAGLFLVLRKSENKWIAMACGSLILLNPLILEFFSLARGYGLSMGFLMMSLYFLFRNQFSYKTYQSLISDFKYVVLFAFLALCSSLSLINYYIAILVVFIIQYLLLVYNKNKKHDKNHISFILSTSLAIIPLVLSIAYLMFLNSLNRLYFGEYSLINMLNSIIVQSLYLTTYPGWIELIIKYFIISIIVATIIFIIFYKKASANLKKITGLFLLIVVGFIIENLIFKAKYPSGRTGLFLIPIISILIYFLLTEVIQASKKQNQTIVSVVASIIIVVPMIINFSKNFTTEYTFTWQYDAHTKDMMTLLKDHYTVADSIYSISNHWLFAPSINYYIHSRNMNVRPTNGKGISCETNFIYDFEKSCDTVDYEVLAEFEKIGTFLSMKKNEAIQE